MRQLRNMMVLGMMSGLAILATGCGDDKEHRADLSANQVGNFDLPELLDSISDTRDNEHLRRHAAVTEQQLDRAFTRLERTIKANGRGGIALDEAVARTLSAKQKQGFTKLQTGLSARVREQAVQLRRSPNGIFVVVPTDGVYEKQGPGLRADEVAERPTVVAGRTDGNFTIAAIDSMDHRVGNGYWSWSLSYKWWGVRLSVNHNFLNYLCNNTEWLLGRVGLPGWIKYIVRPIGCLLHSLDSGADGASISITWTGAFWYST